MAKMQAPENGVAVRMYRQGHGDCFLLAFPREGGGDPVYVLIDCGYKPGSQEFVHGKKIGDTVKHISKATGDRLDLVIITHEHQDHVNGFWKKRKPYFQDFEIGEAWLAWTEDPHDPLANDLRERHKDQLLSLVEARRQLAAALGADDLAVSRLDSFLSLEFGGESDSFNLQAMLAAASDPSKSTNKQAMKLVKDKAFEQRGVRYLSPGGKPLDVAGSDGVRAFVLGPPRSEDLLGDEDPVGSEGFPGEEGVAHGFSFSAAVQSASGERAALFAEHYHAPVDSASQEGFFGDHYGAKGAGKDDADKIEAPANAPWRRIDAEWLYAADSLALALNRGVNNTSLVLAFELPGTKKVLLFAGDAQRGNWISWDDSTWQDGAQTVTARDLLGRTVLYKVGHHGSHNATLAGKADDDYPNLSWMGRGAFAGEFAAMITAVSEWARTKNNPPWRHPLDSIKEALVQKAQGRVFQIDEPELVQPADVPDAVWEEFAGRVTVDELFVEYVIRD